MIAGLDTDQRQELLDEFHAVLNAEPATAGQDEIAVHHQTDVTVLHRTP